ncbi:hypothetical protein [Amycolatopsis thermoflava]|uniref:hypothetical protein n=1 Tax=Amycolatopsis thermoflava TaxID=84480 RepID=UPI003F4A215B
MQLTHLATTSKNGGCPELYASDRDTYVVQGTRVTDPGLLGRWSTPLMQHEAVVEIPRHLFALAALAAADSAVVVDSGRGTYLVRGAAVTDADALATVRERGLPDHETVVQIAGAVLAPTGSA